ncbi:hypothetical protein [Legionella sp. km772]|uniref:hypothetical protein n=1 Tax=Legionella sp. km772 TaxID=2498111 RepID=UPI000F8E4A1B|nr:hypothetical protein [Legionella sp. km772]RUR13590.1 hypothetical protein ELY15_01910 [Legionella sp. km772]
MNLVLADVLAYQNFLVLKQFCHTHSEYSLTEAEQLFKDLLAWFWLRDQRAKKNKTTYLFGPLLILDELWHLFILHTRDYCNFSFHYFGDYVHHEPEPPGFEHRLTHDELTDYLNDCINYLGEEWVARRFAEALS